MINRTAFSRYAFAAETKNISNITSPEVLYLLGQCTLDISQQLCHKCLTQAYEKRKPPSPGLAYLPSCQLRYQTDNFFQIDSEPRSNQDNITDKFAPPTAAGRRPRPRKRSKSRRTRTLVIAIAAVVTALLTCFVFFLTWMRKPKKYELDEVITMESLQFDFDIIRDATNNFSEDNKLGIGGFGAVYKGELQDGQEIAVKRLSSNSKQGIQEFKTEVVLVAKLQHKNLVRLLGFCVTEEEKLLVYEFLPNSSLDRYLSNFQHTTLDWKTRYKIIDGIAKGLLYLHEDSRFKIVHRDLKPNNILLDRDMVPKIADFGMAKLFGEDEGISNRIVGTHGYMAPEYMKTGRISLMADVYSFGVLVLELVSGQRIRSLVIHTPQHQESLLHYAWRLWNDNEALELVDTALDGNFLAEEAKRCIHVALSCVQEDAEKRPTMTSIVSVLNRDSNSIPPLPKSGISIHEPEHYSSTYSGTQEITSLIGR